MKKMWEFFENMNEVVYVSDVDSYEVIYMNRAAREIYGIQSIEELKGKKCYELLQGSFSPCAICTNKKLRSGSFEEWDYFNPVLDKNFMLKDTLIEEDGRRCRVEIAIEVSTQAQQRETIKDYVHHETMINEGLRLSLSAIDPDESIAILLEYFGRALQCDRVYIFEENQETYDNTYEWCAKGVVPQKDNLQNLSYDVVKLWLERFEDEKNVIIKELEDIRESDPAMYDCLKPQDIHSLVTSPLVYNNKIIGFYGVDNPPRELLDNISMLFMITGHFIVSMLKRRDLYRRLENLSFYDQLTGFGNRHLMNDYFEDIQKDKSIGVVYCDVMGLKRENDTHGHQAGDSLLLRACGCLTRVFPEYTRFRVGGDEFLVLCAGITEETLRERQELLKKEMKEDSALMAVGCVWRPDSEGDADQLLMEADERMYEDKREYYKRLWKGTDD
jgi:diguanylate cyclase (GGDEF)-like protein